MVRDKTIVLEHAVYWKFTSIWTLVHPILHNRILQVSTRNTGPVEKSRERNKEKERIGSK